MSIKKHHILIYKIQNVLLFMLIMWFLFAVTPLISPYTVSIGVKLIKVMSGLSSHKATQVFSVVIVNIDQYIAILIAGAMAGGLILRGGNAGVLSLMLFICYILPQVIIFSVNWDNLYGDKHLFLFGKIIVLSLIYCFSFVGVSLPRLISRFMRRLGC